MRKPCIKPVENDTLKTPKIVGEIAVQQLIKGKVVDEKNEPIPFASVGSGRTGFGVTADAEGGFVIKTSLLTNEKKLIISSAGFETKEVVVNNSGEEIIVQLKARTDLPAVVLTTSVTYKKGMVMGAYTKVSGKQLSVAEPIITPATPTLTIYPNPALAGSAINISFQKMEEGYYQLLLLSVNGQSIERKEVWIDAEARLLNFNLPAVTAGSYFLVLINKKTAKKTTAKIIIQ